MQTARTWTIEDLAEYYGVELTEAERTLARAAAEAEYFLRHFTEAPARFPEADLFFPHMGLLRVLDRRPGGHQAALMSGRHASVWVEAYAARQPSGGQ
jgi:hypothetical protein